ncbi:hypothetical protein HPCPY1662_1380 [Helicobacter pylori CPY1662]|nr:hypothetical protein HPCPY1662_1380 [Helicobacter pylori CPY1662]
MQFEGYRSTKLFYILITDNRTRPKLLSASFKKMNQSDTNQD